MSAVDDRVIAIRMFTVPTLHVNFDLVGEYAALAAPWERMRLLEHQDSVLADEEHFLQQSATLQRLSKDVGLRTCTSNNGEAIGDGVVGITDLRGFLPGDPGYLRRATWHESTAVWCHE